MIKSKFFRTFIIVVLVILFLYCFIYVYSVINISNSGAYEFAKTYVKQDEEIRERFGEVIDFGNLPTGGIGHENDVKIANLNFVIIGKKEKAEVIIKMTKNPLDDWEIQELSINKME